MRFFSADSETPAAAAERSQECVYTEVELAAAVGNVLRSLEIAQREQSCVNLRAASAHRRVPASSDLLLNSSKRPLVESDQGGDEADQTRHHTHPETCGEARGSV